MVGVLHEPYPQAARPDAGRLSGGVYRPFHPVGALQQRAPGLGQLYVASPPLEEPGPELILQLADALAEGGLRYLQAPSGASEAPLLGHRDEVGEVPEVHSTHYKRRLITVAENVLGSLRLRG